MSWRVDDAVSRAGVRDAKIHVAEVSFRLEGLSPRIQVRLFRRPGSREVYFEQSHFLVVPGFSYAPPAVQSDKNEAYALSLVVESMTTAFSNALRRGLVPTDDWLIQNRDF